MRRIELLSPHKEAIRSLLRSTRRDPPLALALNAMAVRSQQWMLTSAGISASGPKGWCAHRDRRCCSPTCCGPGSMMTMTVHERSRRSTVTWRAVSVSSVCFGRCAGFRKRPAISGNGCAAPAAIGATAKKITSAGEACATKLDRNSAPARGGHRADLNERDVAAVRARDVASDGKAQAGPAFVLVRASSRRKERLEHLLAHPGRNARPVIVDGDGDNNDVDSLGQDPLIKAAFKGTSR